MAQSQKICKKCQCIKDRNEFHKNPQANDGLSYRCKMCRNAETRPRYIKNREKILTKSKLYQITHKKERAIWRKQYYENNKVQILMNYSQSPRRAYYCMSTSATKRSIDVNITEQQFVQWYINQPKECYYCEIPDTLLKDVYHIPKCHRLRLTIDRKNNNTGYYINNIVLACSACNTAKGKLFTHSEMLIIAKQFIKPKWQLLCNNREVA